MISAGLLICVVASLAILCLLARSKGSSLETVFIRISWLPPIALLAQIALWPFLRRLGYATILPPLLTCVASLFLAVMGATLIAVARQRDEPDGRLVRATFVASSPGMLLAAYVIYAFLGYFIRGAA